MKNKIVMFVSLVMIAISTIFAVILIEDIRNRIEFESSASDYILTSKVDERVEESSRGDMPFTSEKTDVDASESIRAVYESLMEEQVHPTRIDSGDVIVYESPAEFSTDEQEVVIVEESDTDEEIELIFNYGIKRRCDEAFGEHNVALRGLRDVIKELGFKSSYQYYTVEPDPWWGVNEDIRLGYAEFNVYLPSAMMRVWITKEDGDYKTKTRLLEEGEFEMVPIDTSNAVRDKESYLNEIYGDGNWEYDFENENENGTPIIVEDRIFLLAYDKKTRDWYEVEY